VESDSETNLYGRKQLVRRFYLFLIFQTSIF